MKEIIRNLIQKKKKTIQNQKNKIKNILRSTLHAIKINNTNQKSFSQI